jgi:hypothetical protein
VMIAANATTDLRVIFCSFFVGQGRRWAFGLIDGVPAGRRSPGRSLMAADGTGDGVPHVRHRT